MQIHLCWCFIKSFPLLSCLSPSSTLLHIAYVSACYTHTCCTTAQLASIAIHQPGLLYSFYVLVLLKQFNFSFGERVRSHRQICSEKVIHFQWELVMWDNMSDFVVKQQKLIRVQLCVMHCGVYQCRIMFENCTKWDEGKWVYELITSVFTCTTKYW